MMRQVVTVLLIIALLGCSNAGVRAQADKPVLSLTISKIENLDAEVWQRKKVGTRSCAVLPAGKAGTVPLPIWWQAGLRPEKGSSWLLKINFKDNFSAPVVVKAFAGLPGHYELHRIGGLKDGKWKVALIPLPWDMVMRRPGEDFTEIQFRAPGQDELMLEKIMIVKGDPQADEKRWAGETRAWVERVQADKRDKAELPPVQTAVLPPAVKGRPAVPYVRPYHQLIYPNSAPQEGEAGAVLAMRQARNEIEPLQFGVYANGRELKQVRVALKGGRLTGPNGNALDAEIIFRTAEYPVVSKTKLLPQRLYPQRLWPAYAVDIPADHSHMFWLTVETSYPASQPGIYGGTVTITAAGAQAELPLSVEVLPVKLLTMTEAGLTMGGCTTGLLPAHELDYLVKNNHNGINLWYYGFAPGIKRKSADDFDLEFTIQDDFMAHARAAGIDNFVYFLGGNPYGFPDTMHVEREIYRQAFRDGSDFMGHRLELLKDMCENPTAVQKDIRPLYVKWVRKFMQHAEDNDWPEPILTPFDEPAKWVQTQNWANVYYFKYKDGRDSVQKIRKKGEKKFLADLAKQGIEPRLIGKGGTGKWIKPYFKDACAVIHEGWPKARIYASIHHNNLGNNWDNNQGICFLPDVEVFCTNAIHEDPKLGDKVRAGGPTKSFWQYSGGGDSKPPAEGRYTFGFFFGAFDSRGSLAWAYNWGQGFDTSSGSNWLYGWTTPYSVVPAPYFEGVREAWDDRRYIETLRAEARKAGKAAQAEALLDKLFDRAAATRTKGGRDTVHDFWARTDDPAGLDTMRGEVIDLLLEIGK